MKKNKGDLNYTYPLGASSIYIIKNNRILTLNR